MSAKRPDVRTLVAWAAGALALFLALDAGVGLYADLAWFRSLGQEDRFWTLATAQVIAWAACFVLSAGGAYLLLAWLVGSGGAIRIRRRLGDLEIAEALPERWVRWTALGVAGLVGLLVTAPVSGTLGQQALVALEAAPWGETEPILERDPRFYVFYLPLVRSVWSLFLSWLVWASLASGAFLFLTGRVRAEENSVTVDPLARRCLIYLGVGLLVLLAAHFWISVSEQVSGGPVGYADVHGELPVRRLLAILALASAAGLAVSERTERWRFTISVAVAFGAAWLVGLGFYPEALQRFKVEPNELSVERPYIQAKIQATRRAFGLERIRTTGMDVRETSPPDLDVLRRWTSGLPLWDERPLESTFNQLQGLLAYHRFPDVDNDRYGSRERREQVAIGVREFAPTLLDPSARTWQNLHLRYTHGTGIVSIPVDRVTAGGAPAYFVRDLPPVASDDAPPALRMREPRVFFGELTTQYVMAERDSLPAGDTTTAVSLEGLPRRLAFSWALGSKNILLRQPEGGHARLLWRRDVISRVRSLVPFLFVDPNPYPVVDEGRVKWMVELYAASARYPLSEPTPHRGRRVNYLSGAAKAVVDGVSGQVKIYTVQPDDPILSAWRDVFPGLFHPLSEMPTTLRQHVRYPQALLQTQAEQLTAYHMTEPEVFYHRQELWSVGQEVYESRATRVQPYYLLMPFPGETGGDGESGAGGESGGDEGAGGVVAADDREHPDEFLLVLPFTPRDRDNLTAFIMARNDAAHYGELWLFQQASTEQVFGPRQIEVQIDQDPEISQQLSLWRQLGSRAVRGHLLLVPVQGFLLYVEPLFLVAEDESGAAPGLKRVIAAAGDNVAMSETLDGALRSLMADMGGVEPPVPTDTAAAGEARTVLGRAPGVSRSLQRIRDLVGRAESALQAGDLARFGEIWRELRREAAEDTGAAVPPDTVPGAGGGGT